MSEDLIKENERLRKEVAQWKHEYEILDACCEISKMVLTAQKRILKEIKRIIFANKMPSLPLASVNAILDLINKPVFDFSKFYEENSEPDSE